MNSIYKRAYAKINLTLNILGKRDNGYHNLKSIFQIIDLYDEIYVEKTSLDDMELICDSALLNNKQNIVYKAYLELKKRFKKIGGVKVTLLKKIPIEAGLAGGSADCAKFIIMMNELFNLDLSVDELVKIGALLGADVPACMYDGLLLAEGIGEHITKIDEKIDYTILVIKPEVSFNTGLMFQKYDTNDNIIQEDNNEELLNYIKLKDLKGISSELYNVFEKLLSENSIIFDIKRILIENGALSSLMSGAGSSVFGIFDDEGKAKIAYEKLKDKYEIYLTKPYYG